MNNTTDGHSVGAVSSSPKRASSTKNPNTNVLCSDKTSVKMTSNQTIHRSTSNTVYVASPTHLGPVQNLFDDGDGGLFKRFSQEFSDPELEQMYQSYLSIAMFRFHKSFAKAATCCTALFSVYVYLYFDHTVLINNIINSVILFGMGGASLITWLILHFQKPRKWALEKSALMGVIMTAIWVCLGMNVGDILILYTSMQGYRARLSFGADNLVEILQRPFPKLQMPNSYYMTGCHVLQAALYASLQLRTILVWGIILIQFIISLWLTDPKIYTTSGILMTTALYVTCAAGALLAAIANERFRRRNFYVAYKKLMRTRNTQTAHGGKVPVHGNVQTAKSKRNIQFSKEETSQNATVNLNNSSMLEGTLSPSNQELPSLVQTIADVLQGKLEGYGHPIFWPLTQEMSSIEQFLANFCNPIATFFYRYFLLTSNDKELEARARERGALRAYKAGRSSFLILILSTFVGLINVQAQPLYGDYRFEATLRLLVALSFYVIGFIYCMLGTNRIPTKILRQSELIIAVFYCCAALGHLTVYFASATPANAASTQYFSEEVSAEFIVIYISVSTVVSVRYFSSYCLLMILYTLTANFFIPAATLGFFITTAFLTPIAILLASISEKERRLNLPLSAL